MNSEKVSDTYDLNLSILTNAVELDLLIGQSVVQSLLGGCLNMACFIHEASLWIEEQAVWLVMYLCKVEGKHSKRHTHTHSDAWFIQGFVRLQKLWIIPRFSAGWFHV